MESDMRFIYSNWRGRNDRKRRKKFMFRPKVYTLNESSLEIIM